MELAHALAALPHNPYQTWVIRKLCFVSHPFLCNLSRCAQVCPARDKRSLVRATSGELSPHTFRGLVRSSLGLNPNPILLPLKALGIGPRFAGSAHPAKLGTVQVQNGMSPGAATDPETRRTCTPGPWGLPHPAVHLAAERLWAGARLSGPKGLQSHQGPLSGLDLHRPQLGQRLFQPAVTEKGLSLLSVRTPTPSGGSSGS